MFGRIVWTKVGILALIVLAAAIPWVAQGRDATAAPNCKKVSGDFTLASVTSGCMSPVGICAANTYRGGIKGTSAFTGTSTVATADTPTTGVIVLTGDNVITTRDGTLTLKDAIVLRSTGQGEFASVNTIIGGTGEWAGATGIITGSGTFANGSGQGEYAGEICTP